MTYEDESEYSDLVAAPAQQKLLITILRISNGGESPTMSEMTTAMGASADSNTARLLDGLEKKGYIERQRVASRVQPRGTSLTGRALKWLALNGHNTSPYQPKAFVEDQVVVLPLYGPHIPAGGPAVSTEDRVIDHIYMPAQYVPASKAAHMLEVKGDSMTGEDGILDGDILIVVPYEDPKGEGEIVIAFANGGETVKRLWRDGIGWRLQPSNPDYNDIPMSEGDRVTGLVVGLVRRNIRAVRHK